MTEEKTYRKENLKLADLAEKLMIHANQLSQIINEQTGNSFNDFVNMYRVEEAKRLLSLQKSNLSIEGIAYDAGFNSRAAFYKAFKKITQITPSQFKNIS
jgi:YesN/AraC family two-component response regulator